MADVAATLAGWSSTTGSNAPSGGTTIGTGLDDNLREIQGVIVRGLSHKGADIASATTTDIGAVEGLMHDITGTTTITGLGTVRAGIWKVLKFEGALTLTHNATSLILPGGANITTADGDVAVMYSEGSGNWRCASYVKATGKAVIPAAVGDITGLGTGVATFLATPSSANLISAVTDETGTGALVFATSPTLVTPALGTPASGNLLSCVGVRSLFWAGSAANAIPQGATRYIGLANANATESAVDFTSPFTGTIRRMYTLAGSAQTGGQTTVYTLRVNAGDTSVTCTNSTGRGASDTSNTANVTAGEPVSVKIVTSAGATVTTHNIVFEIYPTS
jgi:hypothetical protein